MSAESRAAIEDELLAWMAEPAWRRDDARFEDLALRLFRFQLAHCEPYARFCRARGADAGNVRAWRDIPPVPTGAFKELALRCFPAEATRTVFRTSGTSTARRGELHLDDLALYEASLRSSLRHGLLPDLEDGERIAIRVLAPSPAEAPDSSLSHMFGSLVEQWGAPGSGFDVADGALRLEPLQAALDAACADERPVALCGTAFAFVHLLDGLDAAGGPALSLPPGSRVMETGGFKGRSREMPRDALYAAIGARLGVPADRVVNQYGMTELGSQFYDSVLADPAGPRRKLSPPWTRVRVVDPFDGHDVEGEAVGAVIVHDLANTGSVAAIQTADLGRRIGDDGFEVLGRATGAESRGCSIAADAMLAGAATPAGSAGAASANNEFEA